ILTWLVESRPVWLASVIFQKSPAASHSEQSAKTHVVSSTIVPFSVKLLLPKESIVVVPSESFRRYTDTREVVSPAYTVCINTTQKLTRTVRNRTVNNLIMPPLSWLSNPILYQWNCR